MLKWPDLGPHSPKIMTMTTARLALLAALSALAACHVGSSDRLTTAARIPVDVYADDANPDSQDRSASDQSRQERKQRREAERRARDQKREKEREQSKRDNPDWPQDRRSKRTRQIQGRDRRKTRGRRGNRGQRLRTAYALLSWAGGDYDFKDGRGVVDNRGNLFRFRTGAQNRDGTGGGLDLKYYDPKHDVYEQTPGQTGIEQADIYLFVSGRMGDGRFRMPMRFGPYYDLLRTEQNSTSDYTRFYSIGVRLELEPQILLIHRRGTTLSLYANFSVGGHVTRIDDEITNDDYHSVGTTVGFEPGIRLIKDELELSLSYHAWDTAVRKSNYENGFAIPRAETEFRGFQVTVGWHF